MKTLLLLLFIISNYSFSYGQKPAELEFKIVKDQLIKEKYPEKDIISDFVKIKVTLVRKDIPQFDFNFSVKLEHVTTSDKDIKLLTDYFVISKVNFHNSNEITKEIILEIFRDTSGIDKSDEVFNLIIEPNTATLIAPFSVKEPEKFTITLVDAQKQEESESPFRITSGANFDFDKTLKASLYFDAQLYKPIIFPCNKNDKIGLGVYASLYNNRYISSDSIQEYSQKFTETIGSGDTVDIVSYNYQIGRSNSIKNIGAEAGLLWSFHSKINKDSDASISFLLPEFGAISRNHTTTYTYEKINPDTIFNVIKPNTLVRLTEREFTNIKYNDVMIGTGFIFRYKSKTYGEFMMKFSTGFNHTYFPEVVLKRHYYDFRFQILDPKVGVNLGGEIRGIYGNGAPYFSVYLSKSFTLNKLTEY